MESKNITWGLVPDYILCRTINLSKYFDLNSLVPEQIFLYFNKVVNRGVTIYLMDKNKYMKRPLKVTMLDYSGPIITVEDLDSPKAKTIILKYIYLKENISPILSISVGGLRQQFSLSENIQIGLYARDFMRNYPQSIFAGSTVPTDKVPDIKFQPHGYLFLASEAGYEILKQNHDTQEQY